MAVCVCLNVFVSELTKLMVVLSKGRPFPFSPFLLAILAGPRNASAVSALKRERE